MKDRIACFAQDNIEPKMPSSTARDKKPASAANARFIELGQLPISIRLGRYQSAILYWGYYEPKYWRNYLHTHSFFEICYAYQGTGAFQMMGKVYKVKAGDLFIAKPGEEHEIISNRRDPLGIYYWAFSLVRSSSPGIAQSPVDVLMDRLFQSTKWVARAPSMLATLQMLTQEISNRAAGYPAVINGLVTKLLMDSARAAVTDPILAEAFEPRATSEAQSMVQTASQYILDNLGRPISLRDVAAQVHVSERHLTRLFHQVKKMTVLDFITQVRLEAASHLLLNQQWAVKKIAAAVGYPDVRYFTTLFRRKMKCTPAMFRRRWGTAFADESRR
jgi:AraC family L-rhamnose operon transcriptional activator RhaR